MNTIKESANLIRDFFKSSFNIYDFSMKIAEFVLKDKENSDLLNHCENLFQMLLDSGTNVLANPSPGIYEFIDGTPVDSNKIKVVSPIFESSFGFFVPNWNVMALGFDAEKLENAKSEALGIDRLMMQENFMLAFCAVWIHESIHGAVSLQNIPAVPDSSELMLLKNSVSKAAKLNNLTFLKPITAHWEEMIAHLVSNKLYFNWVLDNNASFLLSRALVKIFDNSSERKMIIDIINSWCRLFYNVNVDVVYFIENSRASDFLARSYYELHREKILGIEVETTNRFGKPIHKTKRYPSDHSIEEIFGHVGDLPDIEWDRFDNLNKVDQYEPSEATEKINSEIQAAIDRKKTQVVTTPDIPDLVSFAESVSIYNVETGFLTWLEIEAYLYCYPSLNKNIWRNEFEYTTEQILASRSTITLNKQMDNECTITVPTVIYNGALNHFFSLYLHGDVYQKTLEIRAARDEIVAARGEDYYNDLINGLDSIRFVNVSFDNEDYTKRPFISPVSEKAQEFMIREFAGYVDPRGRDYSLTEAFLLTIGSRELTWFKASRYKGVIPSEIVKVMRGQRLVEMPYRGKDLTANEKQANDDAENRNATKFDHVFEQTCVAFSDFIKECLSDPDKMRLEEEISGFYNKFCFTELEKIPIGFTHSSKFKRVKFVLKDIQRNSIAYENINGTALFAHEVGTGKTTSSLACISNAFDTGRAKKALVVVPTTVYEKWINECRNHTEKYTNPETGQEEEVIYYGALPHLNVVGLSNLSDKVMMSLKEYNEDEKKRIEQAKTSWQKFVADIKKNIKGIEQTEVEENDDDEVVDSTAEDNEESTKKLSIIIPQGMANIEAFVNNMLRDVMIEVFAIFGISNESNRNYESIYSVINNSWENNTLTWTMKKYYGDAGVKMDKVWGASSVPTNVHASVILSMVYDYYGKLESNLVATLGTLKEFPNNTIFFTTYVGLSRIGFNNETISMMATKLVSILKGSGMDLSDEQKLIQNVNTILMRSELEAKVLFEDFGFDYIVIDEAHRLKNLITTITQNKDESQKELYPGNKSQFTSIKGGSQSKIALTGFMATMYVQIRSGSRNCVLLTATPFTNSPLEIYSMLTLTSHNYLVEMGYDNVLKFAQDFIKVKSQLSISAEGTIKTKIEPVGYNNLQLLRRIIYTIVDFRSAEESNIIRPCKIVLPIKEKSTLCDSRSSHGFSVIRPVSTIVIPTRQQQLIFDALQTYLSRQLNKRTIDDVFMTYIMGKGSDYIKQVSFLEDNMDYNEYRISVNTLANLIQENFNVTKNGQVVDKILPPIAILKVLMAMRNVSISPYLFRPYVNQYMGIQDSDIDPANVVNQSSKLLFVLDCIKKANEYQRSIGKPYKGFVIYSNLGTKPGKNSPISLLKMLKAYMLDEANGFGYEKAAYEHEDFRKRFDDVEILDGSVTSNPRKKNALMDLFNKGKIKCMITTIQEGVDLNGNTMALFNISVDWNPTDAKQIEGRAWRQGNKNAYCILAYPLTANGSDMAIYQKLQDKTTRLKALWDKSSNVKSAFDLDEFDPEALKMEMISRVEKLAPFIFNEETLALRYEYDILKSKREEDGNIINNYRTFVDQQEILRSAMTLYTRLPKIFMYENRKNELTFEIYESEKALENLKANKNSVLEELPEYEQLIALQNDIIDLNTQAKGKAAEYGMAALEEDAAKSQQLMAEIKSTKDLIKEKEEAKTKLQKVLEDKSKDALKEVEADIKKEEKELEKLKKSREALTFEMESIEVKDPLPMNELGKGNYFETNENKSVVYKHKGGSLDKIDWLSTATYFDLFEGVTRLTETYGNKNSQYSLSWRDFNNSYINLRDINDFYKLIPGEHLNQLYDYMGALGDSISKYKLQQLVEDFYSSYNRKYWNIFYVQQLKASITRSIRDFNSIVEDRDPEEYLREMDQKLEELYEEIGASESMMSVPDTTLEKYIGKAYEIISKRRKEFSSYITLVDGFMNFSELFNIEINNVFIDQKLQKEMAAKAMIQTPETVGEKEAEAMISIYRDKIEVYEEMIEEAGEDEKELYQDKIEVYQEMINELSN